MPAAAPTFSTTMVWPSISPMRCAWMRALTSTPPPAANGTISVMGRVGHSCACTDPAQASTPANAAMNVFCIVVLLVWKIRSIISAWQSGSFPAHAAGLDWASPFLDFTRNVRGQVFGAAALRRHNRDADRLQALAHRGRVHRLARRLVEPTHDRLRSFRGQHDRAPGAAVELRESGLLGRWQIGQHGHPIGPQNGNGLDHAALDLRERG